MVAIVNFIQTDLFFGTINDTASSVSLQHNFAASTVLSYPHLQTVSVNADDGGVSAKISSFTAPGAPPGPFHPGIFATKCTNVTALIKTVDCLANTTLTTWIWG